MEVRDPLKPHVTLRERLRALKKRLSSNDWETKVKVINELGNIPREEAVSLLIDIYESDPKSILGRQIKGILLGHRSRIISPIINTLKNSGRETKLEVAELLIQLDVTDLAAESLLKAYEASDVASQRSIRNALKALDRDKTIEFILSVFKDPNTPYREAAFEILEDIEGIHDRDQIVGKYDIPSAGALPTTEDDLKAAMHSRIEPYRLRVVEEMAKAGDDKHIPYLKLALKDPSVRVRERAIGGLGELYNEEVIDALIESLEGAEERVTVTILMGLVKFVNIPRVASIMMKSADHPNKNIAAIATIALARKANSDYLLSGEIGDGRAERIAQKILSGLVDRLVKLMREHILSLNTEVQLDVAGALIDLKRTDQVEGILIKTLSSQNREIRAAVAQMLGRTGSMRAMNALLKAVNDPDKRVRANVIESLEMIAPEKVKDTILPFLGDPDNRIRANAAKALYKGGEVQGLGILMSMLEDPDELMRLSAAWALGQIGNRIAAKALAEAEKTEEQEYIREVIRKSLAKGPEEAVA